MPKELEEDGDVSDTELLMQQTQDVTLKRGAIKIDGLFMLLFEDLNLLCEWENDEKSRTEKPKNGLLWI